MGLTFDGFAAFKQRQPKEVSDFTSRGSHRAGILKVKTTATQKRLCGKQMLMVGAVGFEPTNSTV